MQAYERDIWIKGPKRISMQSHAFNAPVVGYGVDMVVMGMSIDSSTSSHKACLVTGYLYIAQASGVTTADLK